MTTPSQKLQRIFMSHSHSDNDFGVKIALDLRRVLGEESAVWYDVSGGLHAGDSWWDKIVTELTAREIFIVVLSPDAMKSRWVRREIDTALNEDKQIIPLLWRSCDIRADLKTIHNISFLPPKPHTAAFNELLDVLGLPKYTEIQKPSVPLDDPLTTLVRQMTPQIEASFAREDWPDVIRKVNFLLKNTPGAITSTLYRMQGLALAREGNVQLAQDSLNSALALVSDPDQRLLLLKDYATILSSQGQWSEVLRYAREALRLVPDNVYWLVRQAQAHLQLEHFEEAKSSYDRAKVINSTDVNVQSFGKVLDKVSQSMQQTAVAPVHQTAVTKTKTPTGKIAPPKAFPVLAVGTTVASRYEVTSVVSEDAAEHIYTVTDHEGYQKCWNCDSEENTKGDEFCIDCGAELLDAPYLMHEYPSSENQRDEANVLQGMIVNTFLYRGHTYAIEQPQAPSNTFPNGVRLVASSNSDAGNVLRSEVNEDSTLALLFERVYESVSVPMGLFIVADGIDGHRNGQDASRATIDLISERIVRELIMPPLSARKAGKSSNTLDEEGLLKILHGSIEDANTALCQMNQREKSDMGSTLTGFLLVGDHAYIFNVGDSRTYILRNEKLYQLTNDHSLVGQLVAGGLIEPDEVYIHPQRNQIYRSLGDKLNVQIDLFKQQVHPGDILLSCSDGLWKMVRNPQITAILNHATNPRTACIQLIEAANDNGGEDNVSAIVVFVY